jgi:pilus assembly protein Flp/PilA
LTEVLYQQRSGAKIMKNLLARFAKDESGATAIEYGLIAALISVAVIGAATVIGQRINARLGEVATGLSTPANLGTTPQ